MTAFNMSLIGTPLVAAYDVLTLLVERAEKDSVLIPASYNTSFIQWPTVPGLAL